jgi:DNA polymerase I
MQQLKIIDNLEDLNALLINIKPVEFVSYDVETTGVTKYDRIIGFSICWGEAEAYYVILEAWNTATGQLDQKPYIKEAKELIAALQGKKIICHNAVFDCMITKAYFKIDLMPSVHTDTMILAHLLDENRKVGLKELAKVYFGYSSDEEQKLMKESVLKNGGKLTKTEYEMFKCDAYIMGKYGAKDALLTYKLFYTLVPELYDQKLDKFFYEEESMPLLRGPTYDLNTTGLKIDQEALLKLKKELQAECAAAKSFIYDEIYSHIKEDYPGTSKSNTFNIGSSSQLSWLLFDELSLEFTTLTKEGKNVCKALGMKLPYTYAAKRDFIARCLQSVGDIYQPEVKTNTRTIRAKKVREPWSYIACDKSVLQKYAIKFKWIAKLLEYQKKMKLLSTYIEGIESRVQYGIIQPSLLQHGTTSGRYSSRNPNFQNLPRDDQRVKECIVSRPGKVFISADYSQLEPRTFAFYSKDPRLMSAFDGTTDFYSVVGSEVYDKIDCTLQKDGSPDAFGVKYKKLRDLSKVIALASAYGATPHQLAPTTGKSIDDTAEDMNKYFERFPGVRKMMLEAHGLAKELGYVTNLYGRPRRIPDAKKIVKIYGNLQHSDLPYDARKLLNLACNHRIQSTAASIVNRAAIRFYNDCKQAGIECNIVLQVHDELVVEGSEQDAENISILLQVAMEETNTLEGVPLEAIPRITRNLAK